MDRYLKKCVHLRELTEREEEVYFSNMHCAVNFPFDWYQISFSAMNGSKVLGRKPVGVKISGPQNFFHGVRYTLL